MTALEKSSSMPIPLSPEEAEKLLNEVDYVLFDIDGVIWSGEHVFYQLPETLLWLSVTMGKKVRFMTNNATRTRVATKDEFKSKGFDFVTNEMIYSSAYVAALELKARWAQRKAAETSAALSKVVNPFADESSKYLGADEDGGQKQNKKVPLDDTETVRKADAVDVAIYERQASITRFESDRFPYNVFVVGEKGLHDELREVALAHDAMTVGLELVLDPRSPHTLLRTPMYPNALKALNEPIIPVGVRVLGNIGGGATTTGCSTCASTTVASSAPAAGEPKSNASPADLSASQSFAHIPSTTVHVSDCGSVRYESIESLDCGAVVVGLDRHVNMLKLSLASLILQRAERLAPSGKATPCDFIATNEDPSITIGAEGFHFPGAGSIVAMLKEATGKDPDFVCGKPHQLMAKVFLENEGVTDPSRCLMVGDRLTTDIAFGRGMGARTLMVLTGAETMRDIEAADAAIRPEFVAPSAASLMYTASSDV